MGAPDKHGENQPRSEDATGDPASLQHPMLQQLYRYWDSKRSGRMAPRRADIDPADFYYAIGWVHLFDVSRGVEHFVVRVLAGQAERAFGLGVDFRTPEDAKDVEFHEMAQRDLRWVLANGKPLRSFHDVTTQRRRYRLEGVMLPLSDDGQTVNMVLIASVPPVGG